MYITVPSLTVSQVQFNLDKIMFINLEVAGFSSASRIFFPPGESDLVRFGRVPDGMELCLGFGVLVTVE